MDSALRKEVKAGVRGLQQAATEHERVRAVASVFAALRSAQADEAGFQGVLDQDTCTHVCRIILDVSFAFGDRRVVQCAGKICGIVSSVYGLAPLTTALVKLQATIGSRTPRSQLACVQVVHAVLRSLPAPSHTVEIVKDACRLMLIAVRNAVMASVRSVSLLKDATGRSIFERAAIQTIKYVFKTAGLSASLFKSILGAAMLPENDDTSSIGMAIFATLLRKAAALPQSTAVVKSLSPDMYHVSQLLEKAISPLRLHCAADFASCNTTGAAEAFARQIGALLTARDAVNQVDAYGWTIMCLQDVGAWPTLLPQTAKVLKSKPEASVNLAFVLFVMAPIDISGFFEDQILPLILTHATASKDELRACAQLLARGYAAGALASAGTLSKLLLGALDVLNKKKATVPLWQSRAGLVSVVNDVAAEASRRGIAIFAAPEVLDQLVQFTSKETHDVTRRAALLAIGNLLQAACGAAGAGASAALPKDMQALFAAGLKQGAVAGPSDGYAESLFVGVCSTSQNADQGMAAVLGSSEDVVSGLIDLVAKSGSQALVASKKAPAVWSNMIFACALLARIAMVHPSVQERLTNLRISAEQPVVATASKTAVAAKDVKKPVAKAAPPPISAGGATAKTYNFWDLLSANSLASITTFSPALAVAQGKNVAEVESLSSIVQALLDFVGSALLHPAVRAKIITPAYLTAIAEDFAGVTSSMEGLTDEEKPKPKSASSFFAGLVTLLAHPMRAVRASASALLTRCYAQFAATDAIALQQSLLHAVFDRITKSHSNAVVPTFQSDRVLGTWTGIGDGPYARHTILKALDASKGKAVTDVDGTPLYYETAARAIVGSVHEKSAPVYSGPSPSELQNALSAIFQYASSVKRLDTVLLLPVILLTCSHPAVCGATDEAVAVASIDVHPTSQPDVEMRRPTGVDPKLRVANNLWQKTFASLAARAPATPADKESVDTFVGPCSTPADGMLHDDTVWPSVQRHMSGRYGIWSRNHCWRICASRALTLLSIGISARGTTDRRVKKTTGASWLIVQEVIPLCLRTLQQGLTELQQLSQDDLNIWKTPQGTLYSSAGKGSPFEEDPNSKQFQDTTSFALQDAQTEHADWAADIERQLADKKAQHASDAFSSAAIAAARSGKAGFKGAVSLPPTAAAVGKPAAASGKGKPSEMDAGTTLLHSQHATRMHVQALYEHVMGALHVLNTLTHQAADLMTVQAYTLLPALLPFLGGDFVGTYAAHFVQRLLRLAVRSFGDKLLLVTSEWTHAFELLQSGATSKTSGTKCNVPADVYGRTGVDLSRATGAFRRLIAALSSVCVPQAGSTNATRKLTGAALQFLQPLLRGILTASPPLPVLQQALTICAVHLPADMAAFADESEPLLFSDAATLTLNLPPSGKTFSLLQPAIAHNAGAPRSYQALVKSSDFHEDNNVVATPRDAYRIAAACEFSRQRGYNATHHWTDCDLLSWRLFREMMLPALLHVAKVAPRSTPAPEQLIYVLARGTTTHVADRFEQHHWVLNLGEASSVLGGVGLLSGVAHVRAAALVVLDTVMDVTHPFPIPPTLLPTNLVPQLFLAVHDIDDDNAAHAKALWDRESFLFHDSIVIRHFLTLLSFPDEPIRHAAAASVAVLLRDFPAAAVDTVQWCIAKYKEYCDPVIQDIEAAVRTRTSILSCLGACADKKALPISILPALLPFFIQHGLADQTAAVSQAALQAGKSLIDSYGTTHAKLILPVLESFLASAASSPLAAPSEHQRDAQREGAVVLLGSAAKYLASTDPKMASVIKVLLDTLNTPSEPVQRSVAQCLAPLCKLHKEDANQVVEMLFKRLLSELSVAVRRGAAFGLAGTLKGYGLAYFKPLSVMQRLQTAAQDSKNEFSRESAMFAYECMSEILGIVFEPYLSKVLPMLLKCYGDGSAEVRNAAQYASKGVMSVLTAHGVKLIVPTALRAMDDNAWRSKHAAIQLLGYMAYCAPKQLGSLLPQIVPKLCTAFEDPHPKVQQAGREALQDIGKVIKNPEVVVLVPRLLAALSEPTLHTMDALQVLAGTDFVHAIDPPSLALIVPILRRGLLDRATPVKTSAGLIVGNMCSLIADPNDFIPYVPELLPCLKAAVVDPIPDVRAVASRAFGSLVRGLGQVVFPDLITWLIESLQSDVSTVERSGGAQGLSEVLTAVGEPQLSQVVAMLESQSATAKPSAREGMLWLVVFLPSVMGHAFSSLIRLALPIVLLGLSDDVETVREVALRAGKVIVKQHSRTDALVLLAPLENGLFSPSWRIRQASVQLVGDLLTQLSGVHHHSTAVVAGNTDADGTVFDVEDAYASEDDEAPDSGSESGSESEEEEEETAAAPEPAVAPVAKGKDAAPKTKDLRASAASAAAAARNKGKPIDDTTGAKSRADRKSAGAGLGAKASGRDTEAKLAAARAKQTDAGTLDETYSSHVMDAATTAVIRIIGVDARNRVFAALYMVRCDVSAVVRQAALKVWKDLVQNTPKTLREILPALMKLEIDALATSNDERRIVACRCLGEVVRKLGDRVLPEIVPILRQGLLSTVGTTRCGVCLGLAEVIEACTRRQIETHMAVLMPAIRDALCDELSEVRDAAARAFNVLQTCVGTQAVDEAVPALLQAIETAASEEDSLRSLAGLQNIVAARGKEILPLLVPRLLQVPISPTSCKALKAVAKVTGSVMHYHLSSILDVFIDSIAEAEVSGAGDADAIGVALSGELGQTVATVVQSIDDVGVSFTIGEIVKYLSGAQAAQRRIGAVLLNALISGSSADYRRQIPYMIKELLARFTDTDEKVVRASWDALLALVNKIPQEDLVDHLEFVRSIFSTMVSETRFRKGGIGAQAVFYIPGLSLPKGLDAVLPIYLRGLMYGTAEQRELAALGLGELLNITAPDTLKSFYVKITGPLIRIVAEKFPWSVKAAILGTLNQVIDKGGVALKPFQPQLQATFSKALSDPTQAVRTHGAVGLGKLMPLATRVDPLVNELCGGISENVAGIQDSMMHALVSVYCRGGEKITAPSRTKTIELCMTLLDNERPATRHLAGGTIGAALKHAEAPMVQDTLSKVCVTSSAQAAAKSNEGRDGHTAVVSCALKYAGGAVAAHVSSLIGPHISIVAKDSDDCTRAQACHAIGHLLANAGNPPAHAPGDLHMPEEATAIYKTSVAKVTSLLISLVNDSDAEVRKAAIDACKRFARYAPGAAVTQSSALIPILVNFITKEGGNMVLRMAAERALVYMTQIHKDDAHFSTLLAALDGPQTAFLNDYARKVLRKMDAESDDEDTDE